MQKFFLYKNQINTIYKNFLNDKDILKSEDNKKIICKVINLLNSGKIRVSNKIEGNWFTYKWIKKSILLFFCMNNCSLILGNKTNYFDKIDSKFINWDIKDFKKQKIRVVQPSIVRKGAYIEKKVILMPSFINIGAYIGKNSMIDTWSTIGSCAQIGENVHISGGVGIGGVLEPLQDNSTIIENNCFIGARSEIVEGVIVGEGSVISMGVFIGKSTKIYDRRTGKIFYGKVPPFSVVVSGSLPRKNNSYSLYSAIIVKTVDKNTRKKVSVNDILRFV